MNKFFTFPLLGLTLVGCGVTPNDGTFEVENATAVDDGCDFRLEQSEDAFVDIKTDASGHFTMDIGEDASLNCEMKQKKYTCDTFNFEMDALGDGSAMLTVGYTANGAFSNPDEGSISLFMSGACDGENCDQMTGVPCTSEFAGTLKRSEN